MSSVTVQSIREHKEELKRELLRRLPRYLGQRDKKEELEHGHFASIFFHDLYAWGGDEEKIKELGQEAAMYSEEWRAEAMQFLAGQLWFMGYEVKTYIGPYGYSIKIRPDHPFEE